MGTNFYLITKNKELAHEKFEYDYRLREDPYLCYAQHLNKLSYGWLPLFQIHSQYKTFAELKEFIKSCGNDFEIYDENGENYTLEEYEERVVGHASATPRPLKWVYEVSDFDKKFVKDREPKKSLYTVGCEPEEADIWTPFDHMEYSRSRHLASMRLKAYDVYDDDNWNIYIKDPDYPFDWHDGEFS